MRVDRRDVLKGVLGAGAYVSLSFAGTSASSRDESAKLGRLLDEFLHENLIGSPELATSLGLDRAETVKAKSRLDDRSFEGLRANKRRIASQLDRLNAIEQRRLSASAAVSYEAVRFSLAAQHASNGRFQFGDVGAVTPYIVSQVTGAYTVIPEFLDSTHEIRKAEDADAYNSRVEAFATVLDQETSRIEADAAHGVVAPDFVLARTLEQMRDLKGTSLDDALVVASIRRRAHDAGISERYARDARRIYGERVLPALDRQIASVSRLRDKASGDAGVWKLPRGDEYYAAALYEATTTTQTQDEVHRMGRELTAELTSRIDVLLRAQGVTQGSVAERLHGIYSDPKFHYPNTDSGRRQMIEDLNGRLQQLNSRLAEAFSVLPKAAVEIARVPAYLEAGAPPAYYRDPSLDGSRPGVFYLNLRDTNTQLPNWVLPTTTFHETNPGHHLQQALAQEHADVPLIRKVLWSRAYGEGWAMYAEQLADELGLYDNDPWGRIGYVWAALLRACRLVVDTGVHAKRWSREQSIEWMRSNSGADLGMLTAEVERYCVQPGNACSYMVGKSAWLSLRERARTQLGERFQIREFHDAGLLSGAVPLVVLTRLVDAYIERCKRA